MDEGTEYRVRGIKRGQNGERERERKREREREIVE